MENPSAFSSGSKSKVSWVCDCGKSVSAKLYDVVRGHTTSCGRCDELPASHWTEAKFGKLRMKDPAPTLPGSSRKVEWNCDCGRVAFVSPYRVTNGKAASCGRCSKLPAQYWNGKKFGRLTMRDPAEYSPGSNVNVAWDCDCGRELTTNVYTVTSGGTRSCGRCIQVVHEWYSKHQDEIRSLKTPILPEHLPDGRFKLLEPVLTVNRPVRAVCGVCSNEFSPLWGNVRAGRSMTCGCASVHVSRANLEIADFVRSLGFEARPEHEVGGLRFDVGIPAKKLLIEHNGLKWHSSDASRGRDLRKFNVASVAGWSLISLFEDEWSASRLKVEALLKNRLSVVRPRSVRPSKCTIEMVTTAQANAFYDRNHYIGACKGALHYGVRFEGAIVACMSFGRPSRQTIKHPWELVRMASDPLIRVHGIWSKLLGMFVAEHRPASIVSYSDNRLFPGAVYYSLGFVHDGNVAPDYYWTKDGKRHHKSGLRKPKGHVGTENALRISEGYSKVWDLGKKRWVLVP